MCIQFLVYNILKFGTFRTYLKNLGQFGTNFEKFQILGHFGILGHSGSPGCSSHCVRVMMFESLSQVKEIFEIYMSKKDRFQNTKNLKHVSESSSNKTFQTSGNGSRPTFIEK